MNAGNKNTPSVHHPQRGNVITSMVGLMKQKRSHVQKISPKIVNPRDITGNAEEEKSIPRRGLGGWGRGEEGRDEAGKEEG